MENVIENITPYSYLNGHELVLYIKGKMKSDLRWVWLTENENWSNQSNFIGNNNVKLSKGWENFHVWVNRRREETYGWNGMKYCFSSSHSVFPLMMSLMSITANNHTHIYQLCISMQLQIKREHSPDIYQPHQTASAGLTSTSCEECLSDPFGPHAQSDRSDRSSLCSGLYSPDPLQRARHSFNP